MFLTESLESREKHKEMKTTYNPTTHTYLLVRIYCISFQSFSRHNSTSPSLPRTVSFSNYKTMCTQFSHNKKVRNKRKITPIAIS